MCAERSFTPLQRTGGSDGLGGRANSATKGRGKYFRWAHRLKIYVPVVAEHRRVAGVSSPISTPLPNRVTNPVSAQTKSLCSCSTQ
jgi:hypothetical protein